MNQASPIQHILSTLQLLATLRGLNLITLSRAAGLGQDTVSRWLNGSRRPKAEELDAALRVVGKRLGAVDIESDPEIR